MTEPDQNKDRISFETVIPSEILLDHSIESACIRVYGIIKSLTRLRGYCFASNAYLAELIGFDDRTIQKHLKSLKDAGYIEVETEKNGMNWQRKIYVGLDLNKSLRRGEKGTPPTPKKAPPHAQKGTHIEEEIKEEEKKEIVCSTPGGAHEPAQARENSKKDSFPCEIEKTLMSGLRVSVKLEDVFRKAVVERKNWISDEMRESWQVLVDYKGAISDPMLFIEGVIKKIRNRKWSEKQSTHKQKGTPECQKTQTHSNQKSEPSNRESSEKSLPALPLIFAEAFRNLS